MFEFERRLREALSYEAGEWRSSWSKLDTRYRVEALLTIAILKMSQAVPKPASDRKIIFLSPSANNGYIEGLMQKTWGNKYLIIAADLVDVNKLSRGFIGRGAKPLRSDGARLPFANSSVDLIFDRAGAMYYEAKWDRENPQNNGSNTLQLFETYRRVLRPGSPLIIDQNTSYDNSTGPLVDDALHGQKPKGFGEPFVIGFLTWQYRIYQKI